MNATILDGKQVAFEIREHLKKEVDIFTKQYGSIGLNVILVGNDPASEVYVNSKKKAALEVGIHSKIHRLPSSTTQDELLSLIHKLNQDLTVHGILVQLPLPKSIHVQTVMEAIDPNKDVDGFHPVNVGHLNVGNDSLLPCTPYGVLQLLKRYEIPLQGKHAVIVGHSYIVGRPMATLLLNENATVSVCHAFTQDLPSITRMADLLIVAVGKKHLITADMVKPGAVVVDVGINRENGKILGDCDFEALKNVASFITPVPGGVGPMTIATLLQNTLKAAKIQSKKLVNI